MNIAAKPDSTPEVIAKREFECGGVALAIWRVRVPYLGLGIDIVKLRIDALVLARGRPVVCTSEGMSEDGVS